MKLNRTALRTIKILEYIANQKDGCTLLEITEALDIPKSSAFDIVKTLLYKKMIVEDQNHGKLKYKMGINAFIIGSGNIERLDLVEAAKNQLIETANHFNATAFLAILDNKMVTYLYKYEAPHRIVTNANIGTRKPIYSTALGKCLLAFQRKPEVIKDILKEIDFKPLTEYTITSPQKYLKELKRVKNIGYAVDFQEDSIYQICIAAPIFNHNKNVVAAISCIFLYDTNLRIKEIGEEMKRIALTISKKLGYIDDTGRRNIHGK